MSYLATLNPTREMNGLMTTCAIYFDAAPDGLIPPGEDFDQGEPEFQDRCNMPLIVQCKL